MLFVSQLFEYRVAIWKVAYTFYIGGGGGVKGGSTNSSREVQGRNSSSGFRVLKKASPWEFSYWQPQKITSGGGGGKPPNAAPSPDPTVSATEIDGAPFHHLENFLYRPIANKPRLIHCKGPPRLYYRVVNKRD